MRVAIVTTVHRPWDGRIFYRQARTLASEGHEVFIIHQSGEADETRGRVTSVGFPRPSNRLARARRGRALIREALAMSADVVHVHDPELLVSGVLLCRRRRVAFIYDIHEDYVGMIAHKAWIPRPVGWLVRAFVAAVERVFVPRCDGLVVADDQLLERFRGRNSRVVVAPNYPPADIFTAPTATARDEIVYVGGISPVRGAFVMLDAMARVRERFPGMRLAMIGPIHAEKEEIGRRARALGEGAATIEPPVSYEDLPGRIAGAKVGLALLQRNRKFLINVPTKIFDYMAEGVPYVASDFPHLAKLVGQTGGRLVDPSDVEAAAEAVIALLADDRMREETGRRGRKAFEEKFNWQKRSAELVELYRGIEERMKASGGGEG